MDGSQVQRSEPHVINISIKKGPIDRTFLIGMGAIKYHVYASSLAQAKQKAVEHFKPKKKDRAQIWAREV